MRIWLDASVARKSALVRDLAELAAPRAVELLVHAHVYLELSRHARSVFADEYDRSLLDSRLREDGIRVERMVLDVDLAHGWAQTLALRFPGDAWERAKKDTIGGELKENFAYPPGWMPMTTDWWVALEAERHEGDCVAVDDQGVEWDHLRSLGRAMRGTEAMDRLRSLSPAVG